MPDTPAETKSLIIAKIKELSLDDLDFLIGYIKAYAEYIKLRRELARLEGLK